jgi:hypothetical protein
MVDVARKHRRTFGVTHKLLGFLREDRSDSDQSVVSFVSGAREEQSPDLYDLMKPELDVGCQRDRDGIVQVRDPDRLSHRLDTDNASRRHVSLTLGAARRENEAHLETGKMPAAIGTGATRAVPFDGPAG